ncbi:helix-turn-helix domain-containing protein [Streptomyces sp. NPDC006784]|uniref:helix-turn-helix domain-containing protein n=1 Tax=Streptomyces sp. NPDC006784 TaxID=3364764 RepID=UPI0036AED95D
MGTTGECVDVSVEEVGQWAEITALALVTTRIKAVSQEKPFVARLRTMPLGASQMSELSYSALVSQRTPRLIRQSDPELFQLVVINSGRQRIEQARNTGVIGSGQMVLYDSSRPFDAFAEESPVGTRAGGVMFQFPKSMLCFPARRLDRLLAVPMTARRGPGRLVAQFLTAAAAEYRACTPSDALRLGTTAVDLVSTVLAHHLDRMSDVLVDSRKRALYLRVTSFVQEHLGDPALTVDRIAAAHHMSVRSLHRLFQQHGNSVRAWLRDQRLERCRRDLADPLQRHLSASAIAARWGYPRPADFNRAFRARYGVTPGAYRNRTHHETAAGISRPAAKP